MTATSRQLGVWVKVFAIAAGVLLLLAYIVQIQSGMLSGLWFELAWAFAVSAVQSGGFSMVKETIAELELIQNRVAPRQRVRCLVNRLFRFQLGIVMLGMSVLVVISHMSLDAPEVKATPWILPAFLWAWTPLCMWAAVVWNRPGRRSFKALLALATIAYLIGHRAFAFQMKAALGDSLTWGLFLLGAAGLICTNQLLQKKTIWVQGQAQTWGAELTLCFKQWSGRTQRVESVYIGWLIPAISNWFIRRFDAQDFWVANEYVLLRCLFYGMLMFSALRSGRSHWRWQMLPGSEFRKNLGADIFKSTAEYFAIVIPFFIMLVAAGWWWFAPYTVTDLWVTTQKIGWTVLTDVCFALGLAVWVRSISWRSTSDLIALGILCLMLLPGSVTGWPFERSLLQDALMLSATWFMVKRANHKFENSNWPWLNKGRLPNGINKIKGA